MLAEPGPFEAFYNGPLQHPILLWLAAGVAVLLWSTRKPLAPSMLRYCALLTLLSVADAWLTTSSVFGLGPLPSALTGPVPLFFVLAGDFRYLALVTMATAEGGIEPKARAIAVTGALTLIVPILSQVAMAVMPEALDSPRMLFTIYEVGFVALTLALLRWHPRVRALPWLQSVSRFVVLYYSLWATADLIILTTGSDFGFLLRILPNLLYYGGLIAAVGWFASSARSFQIAKRAG